MKKAGSLRSSVRRELGLARPARRCLRLLALAGFFWSMGASAQPPYRQEILPGTSSLDVVTGRACPRFADLDGDGNDELWVGTSSNGFQLFRNVAPPSGPPVLVSVPRTSNPFGSFTSPHNSDPVLADLDGDGDLDLFSGGNSGGSLYFQNVGSSNTPAIVMNPPSANPFLGIDALQGADLGDLDGDGDLDLAAIGGSGALAYYRNTGNASSPAFLTQTGAANPFTGSPTGVAPDFADLDGDGDLDLVAGLTAGGLVYLRNSGSSTAPAFVAVTGSASPFASVALAGQVYPELYDFDRDGDLDVVAGNGPGGFNVLYNTGSATLPAFVAAGAADPLAGLDAGNKLVPDFVDLDVDGDLDMVAVVDGDVPRYFRNTGTAARPAFALQSGSADPFAAIGDQGNEPVADLVDIDGDFDAVTGNYQTYYYNDVIRFLPNVGSPAAPLFQTGEVGNLFAGSVGWGMYNRVNPEFGDLDGDGDFDLVFGSMNIEEAKYFENTGTLTAPSLVERTGTANPFANLLPRNSYLDLVDFDGDGDLDVVHTGRLESMGLLENTGSSSVAAFVARSGSANPFGDVQIGVGGTMDIDGDGDLDFLLGTKGGRLVFYRSGAVLFYDGFESGDTGSWDLSSP